MKLVEFSKMPDGTEIQLEDWSDSYPGLFSLRIVVYPIAERTVRYRWIEGGRKFRLDLSRYENDDEVRADYDALKSGAKKLQECANRFCNGKRDMWILGMDVQPPVDE